MKMRRLTLPLAEARPGMRLAADVRGSGGTVLFAGGTELQMEITVEATRYTATATVVPTPFLTLARRTAAPDL